MAINKAIKEDESLNPINEYGRQKAIAEEKIWDKNKKDTIIGRTSWNINFGNEGRCLTAVMIKSLKGNNAKMAIDNIFTIASAKETAENIYKTLMKNYNGVIHIASPTPISRYEIAETIIEHYKIEQLRCIPCKFNDLSISKNRSRKNILDTTLSIKTIDPIYSDPRLIIAQKINYLNNQSY